MMRLFVLKDPVHQIGVIAREGFALFDRIAGAIFRVRELEIAGELPL